MKISKKWADIVILNVLHLCFQFECFSRSYFMSPLTHWMRLRFLNISLNKKMTIEKKMLTVDNDLQMFEKIVISVKELLRSLFVSRC